MPLVRCAFSLRTSTFVVSLLRGNVLRCFSATAGEALIRNKVSSQKGKSGKLESKLRLFVEPEYRIIWTSEMDARLIEGEALHKESGTWNRVARHVGGRITARQCAARWNSYLKKVQQEGIKLGNWSEEEVQLLGKLVPHNVVKKGTTQEHTDWITIGKHLSRISSECRKKWTSLQVKNLKKGRFTEEEDALIRHRVAEYEAVGIKRGLWADLGREMGRNANTIQERWETVLVADRYYVEQDDSSSRENVKQHKPLLEYKSRRFQWTPELDTLLTEAVGLFKESEGWASVAKHVGAGPPTARQCQNRWNLCLRHLQREGIRLGDWTEDEVRVLEELVPQHTDPHSDKIDWTAIADKLNRVPMNCNMKWNLVRVTRMKKGRFTAEEDALIRKRVLEWGDKGNGLWVKLEKEMGRPAMRIRIRWASLLSHYK